MSPRPTGAAVMAAAALLLVSCGAGQKNGSETMSSRGPTFDADSAFQLLKAQVAFGPRVPNTPAHQEQLRWMVQYLRSRADTVEVDSFTHVTAAGDTLHLANVFARFKPGAADRVLLLAHWDTRPISDQDPDSAYRDKPILGANDGASGVAVLMELADVLSKHSPPLGVDLLFTDGEDYATLKDLNADMYLGAEEFVHHMPSYKPLYGVLVDMVGDQSPEFDVETNSEQFAPEVVQRVWSTAEDLGFGDIFKREQGITIDDDHLPLNQAGIHTIDIIDFDYGPNNAYWHTHEDTVAHTGPRGLQAVGQTLSTLIARGG
jgi:Peptidase family M28